MDLLEPKVARHHSVNLKNNGNFGIIDASYLPNNPNSDSKPTVLLAVSHDEQKFYWKASPVFEDEHSSKLNDDTLKVSQLKYSRSNKRIYSAPAAPLSATHIEVKNSIEKNFSKSNSSVDTVMPDLLADIPEQRKLIYEKLLQKTEQQKKPLQITDPKKLFVSKPEPSRKNINSKSIGTDLGRLFLVQTGLFSVEENLSPQSFT